MEKTFKFRGVDVVDTYCEAFDGLYSRLLITAGSKKLLSKAVGSFTALPSTVFNKSEGGVEKWVDKRETPDKRPGAIVQLWVNYSKKAAEVLEDELGWRIRQGVLVVPTTKVFSALDSENKIDAMRRIGHCGDGYEAVEERYGRKVVRIPIMMGDFYIEQFLGYARGVMGGNLWFFCNSQRSALRVGEVALKAIGSVEGIVTPFDICAAGSKVEANFPEIGPTTNHPYCPTLRHKIKYSRVPEGVASIPEIVINGISLKNVKESMTVAINSVIGINGLLIISSGNFGGKLGKYKIFLKELIK